MIICFERKFFFYNYVSNTVTSLLLLLFLDHTLHVENIWLFFFHKGDCTKPVRHAYRKSYKFQLRSSLRCIIFLLSKVIFVLRQLAYQSVVLFIFQYTMKFAFVSLGRLEYLQDFNIVPRHFQVLRNCPVNKRYSTNDSDLSASGLSSSFLWVFNLLYF